MQVWPLLQVWTQVFDLFILVTSLIDSSVVDLELHANPLRDTKIFFWHLKGEDWFLLSQGTCILEYHVYVFNPL